MGYCGSVRPPRRSNQATSSLAAFKCLSCSSVSFRQCSTPPDLARSATLPLRSRKVSDEQDYVARDVSSDCDGNSGRLCVCGPDYRFSQFSLGTRNRPIFPHMWQLYYNRGWSRLPGTVAMALSVGLRGAHCFEAYVRKGLDTDASLIRAALLRPLPAV